MTTISLMTTSTVFAFLSVRLLDAGYNVAFIACAIITILSLALSLKTQNA